MNSSFSLLVRQRLLSTTSTMLFIHSSCDEIGIPSEFREKQMKEERFEWMRKIPAWDYIAWIIIIKIFKKGNRILINRHCAPACLSMDRISNLESRHALWNDFIIIIIIILRRYAVADDTQCERTSARAEVNGKRIVNFFRLSNYMKRT